jgi:hypothetical protein
MEGWPLTPTPLTYCGGLAIGIVAVDWYPLMMLFGLLINCGCLVGSTIIFENVVFLIIGAEIGSLGFGYIHD